MIVAVVENLDAKRRLFERVDALRRPGALISTNTSGLSIRAMAEGRSEDFQRHFLGAHFFNPVRYMKLLEIIATEKTSPEALSSVESFCDRMMGKGIVHAKDTPNFIANRIGTFALFHTIRQMLHEELTVEEVDAVHRPVDRSSQNGDVPAVGPGGSGRARLRRPDTLPDRGRRRATRDLPAAGVSEHHGSQQVAGQQGGSGIYKKIRKNGDSLIMALDIRKMEYRPQEKPAFPALNAVRAIEPAAERLRALLSGEDLAGCFLWQTTAAQLLYSARRIPEISDDIVNIDRAMRWGYNWELGPFETWDVLGVRETVRRMRAEKTRRSPPPSKAFCPRVTTLFTIERAANAAFSISPRTAIKIFLEIRRSFFCRRSRR